MQWLLLKHTWEGIQAGMLWLETQGEQKEEEEREAGREVREMTGTLKYTNINYCRNNISNTQTLQSMN